MSEKNEWMKEMWFEWKWKWCFRSSIIRNRYFWISFIWLLSYCCIWKYVMIVHFHFHFSFFLDLPKLYAILFISNESDVVYPLAGDYRDYHKTIINGHESYDNTLIMKSKLKWNEMKCELCCDGHCLDLPSLTQIQCLVKCCFLHYCMGHVILESTMWCDVMWLIRHSKSHWKQHSL